MVIFMLAARHHQVVSKILGLKQAYRLEKEILRGQDGEPCLMLKGKAVEHATTLGLEQWSLSISHTHEHAVALAVAIGGYE